MDKVYANGCVTRACGILAVLTFAFVAAAMVVNQAYARIYAYTAPIPAVESAQLVGAMNALIVFCVVGFVGMCGLAFARKGW